MEHSKKNCILSGLLADASAKALNHPPPYPLAVSERILFHVKIYFLADASTKFFDELSYLIWLELHNLLLNFNCRRIDILH